MESTQADPAPPAGQGQSFMTGDCQILNLHVSNKDQVGPLQAGQLPMASGEAQPQGPATMMGHDSSNYAALLPHQATPGLEMPPSAPNRGRGCDGNQFVGMTGHQASQSSFLNGNRSPSPSETSDDSMTVLMQGRAPDQSRIKGKEARSTHAKNARYAATLLSPTTWKKNPTDMLAPGRYPAVGDSAEFVDRPSYNSHIEISDDEAKNNA
ncbi:hypothetical protein VUR80DRAFT_6327 [Thermomyces stellatus]